MPSSSSSSAGASRSDSAPLHLTNGRDREFANTNAQCDDAYHLLGCGFTINDLSDADDAAQRQRSRQTNAKASFDIDGANIIRPQRCMNQNGTAVLRRSGTVLDVLSSAHDECGPGLANANDPHCAILRVEF
jgi:hypothetical protein